MSTDFRHQKLINMSQPTSSGMVQTFSTGCSQDMNDGSAVNFESGAGLNMASGSSFVTASGVAVTNQNVTDYSTGGDIVSRTGAITLTSTAARSWVVTGLAKGQTMDVVALSTFTQILKFSTAHTVRVNTTAGGTTVTFVAGSTNKASDFGNHARFVVQSSAVVLMMAESTAFVTVSTAT